MRKVIYLLVIAGSFAAVSATANAGKTGTPSGGGWLNNGPDMGAVYFLADI